MCNKNVYYVFKSRRPCMLEIEKIRLVIHCKLRFQVNTSGTVDGNGKVPL